MARYIVLRIDDNAQAETFLDDWLMAKEYEDKREQIDPEYQSPGVRLLTPGQENDIVFEPVGYFAAPTLFCTPEDGHLKGFGKTGAGWTRGKKYGWWVCAACKKPSRMWGGRFECVVGNGRNLLKETLWPEPGKEPVNTP